MKIVFEEGATKTHSTNTITEKLKQQGEWDNSTAKTPERTINSYFTQNPEIFEKVAPGSYRLREKYTLPVPAPEVQQVKTTHNNNSPRTTRRKMRSQKRAETAMAKEKGDVPFIVKTLRSFLLLG